MSEIVYILTNEAMPDYVKIGFTNNSLEQRLRQMDRTNVPLPFECFYACEVENARKEEQWLHSIFADRRVREEREFFRVNPERVVAAIKRVETKEVTPNSFSYISQKEKQDVEKSKQIRSKFDFQRYDIPVGSLLHFSRNNTITARVLPKNKIELEGAITSLSPSAQKLLGYKRLVAGTLYWKYQDEILDERRKRIDSGDDESSPDEAEAAKPKI